MACDCIYLKKVLFLRKKVVDNFQALEVAGQVAGTSVSTSPLPYSAIASQCEALGTGTRQRLSSWLTHESHYAKTSEKLFPAISADGHSEIKKVSLF